MVGYWYNLLIFPSFQIIQILSDLDKLEALKAAEGMLMLEFKTNNFFYIYWFQYISNMLCCDMGDKYFK